MEPVEQVDHKSYIGLAFKRLGGKGRQIHQRSSNSLCSNSSSDESPCSAERQKVEAPKAQQVSRPRGSKDQEVSFSDGVRRICRFQGVPPFHNGGNGVCEIPSKKQVFILLHYLTLEIVNVPLRTHQLMLLEKQDRPKLRKYISFGLVCARRPSTISGETS